VVIIKSGVDKRYAVNHVVTHHNRCVPCVVAGSLTDVANTLDGHWHLFDTFAIDEAQFFADLKDFCIL